jgi:cytochrome c oxidase cbb3-type subunit 3
MPPWEAQLSANDIKAVTVFVVSLRGTNPPNPKPPQGEKVSP